MEKINIKRLFLSGFVAGLVFMFVEMILEGFFYLVFGVSESKMYQDAFDAVSKKILFNILNIGILFAICILIMWVYAAIRPRFQTRIKAAFAASSVFWGFAVLFVLNHINLGLFPAGALLGMGYNLVELPAAALAGSWVYNGKSR